MERYHVPAQMNSKAVAKFRLNRTLALDYLECTTGQLQTLQKELLDILSRYDFDIDHAEKIDLNIIHRVGQGEPYVKTIQIKGF